MEQLRVKVSALIIDQNSQSKDQQAALFKKVCLFKSKNAQTNHFVNQVKK